MATRFLDLENCCICYESLTKEEQAASDIYGYVCTIHRNKCIICHTDLTTEEIEISKKTDFYLCRAHWCDCMPDNIPWDYVMLCYECGEKTFCKTCKEYSKDGYICIDCFEKEASSEDEQNEKIF